MERAEYLFNEIVSSGESAINEFIVERQTEALFLDFKRSSDDGKGKRLSQTDRNNLAKAISGFGNSEGGVIVWGVDCSTDLDGADVAKAIKPIFNVTRYVSWLEGAVSGCTIPPHTQVQNKHISIKNGNNGFVVTYIPKSNHSPHQVVGKLQYYIRAGSDFVPTPHQVLAGMFGRSPQPKVIHQWGVEPIQKEGHQIRLNVGVVLMNKGPVIAYDPFVTCTVFGKLGQFCSINIDPTNSSHWHINWNFGMQVSLIAKDDFKLAPFTKVQTISLNVILLPPFNNDLWIEGVVGCRNSPPIQFVLKNEKDNITETYKEYFTKFNSGKLAEKDNYLFAESLLGIKDEKRYRRKNELFNPPRMCHVRQNIGRRQNP